MFLLGFCGGLVMAPQWRDPGGGASQKETEDESESQDMAGSLTPKGESTLLVERHRPILEIQTLIANLYITSAMAKPSPACEPLIGTYHSQSQQIIQV